MQQSSDRQISAFCEIKSSTFPKKTAHAFSGETGKSIYHKIIAPFTEREAAFVKYWGPPFLYCAQKYSSFRRRILSPFGVFGGGRGGGDVLISDVWARRAREGGGAFSLHTHTPRFR